MNIGRASKLSGLSPKMIRYYEEEGLLPKALRTPAGYREYSAADVHVLSFVRRSRLVGFSPDEIKILLSLWRNRQRSARDVKAMAEKHLGDIEKRIEELQVIAGTLSHLICNCRGDDRPECPILETLASEKPLLDSR